MRGFGTFGEEVSSSFAAQQQQQPAPAPQSAQRNPHHQRVPKVVQVGLNCIAVLGIDDRNSTFAANLLLHVRWDPRPIAPAGRAGAASHWKPWIQFHNLVTIDPVLGNVGLVTCSDAMLDEKARRGEMIEVTQNFVATFSMPVELSAYPFDYQRLVITLVSNDDTETIFTHKGDNTIKCNNEQMCPANWKIVHKKSLNYDPPETVWTDLRKFMHDAHLTEDFKPENFEKQPSTPRPQSLSSRLLAEAPAPSLAPAAKPKSKLNDAFSFSVSKKSKLGLVLYRFTKQLSNLSGRGVQYQRLEYYIVAKRKGGSTIWSIIIPTALLALSSMSSFALGWTQNFGDRLQIFFVVILSIYANTFAVRDSIPQVFYFTWSEKVLWAFQLFIYLQIFVAAAIPLTIMKFFGCPRIMLDDPTPQCLDSLEVVNNWCALGALALYCVVTLFALSSGRLRMVTTRLRIRQLKDDSAICFREEEERVLDHIKMLFTSWTEPVVDGDNDEAHTVVDDDKANVIEGARRPRRRTLTAPQFYFLARLTWELDQHVEAGNLLYQASLNAEEASAQKSKHRDKISRWRQTASEHADAWATNIRQQIFAFFHEACENVDLDASQEWSDAKARIKNYVCDPSAFPRSAFDTPGRSPSASPSQHEEQFYGKLSHAKSTLDEQTLIFHASSVI